MDCLRLRCEDAQSSTLSCRSWIWSTMHIPISVRLDFLFVLVPYGTGCNSIWCFWNSIAIRLGECFSSSSGIVARCTAWYVSCKMIILGGRLCAWASNCFLVISSFLVRVHLSHWTIIGFLYCIPTPVECKVVAVQFSPCSSFLGCGVNAEGAPVFQTCLIGFYGPWDASRALGCGILFGQRESFSFI